MIFRCPTPVKLAILKDLVESGFDVSKINFNDHMRKCSFAFIAIFEKLKEDAKHDVMRDLDRKMAKMMPGKGRLPKYWFLKKHLIAPLPKDFLVKDYLLFLDLDENLRDKRIIDQLREVNARLHKELHLVQDELDRVKKELEALRNGGDPGPTG